MWGHLDELPRVTEDLYSLVPARWAPDPDRPAELEARFGVVAVIVVREPLQWWQRHAPPEIDRSVRPVPITYRAVPAEPTDDQRAAYARQARLQRLRERYSTDRLVDMLQVLTVAVTSDAVRNDAFPDEVLTALAPLYPPYEPGRTYNDGDLCEWHGVIYEVLQDHMSQADWRPDQTPALYRPHRPVGQVAEWVSPTGAHDAYDEDEVAAWLGRSWRSRIPANVTEPGTDPRWWEDITDLPEEPEPEPEPGSVDEWAPGQDVAVGDERNYGGVVYVALVAHTTHEGWLPPATIGHVWEVRSEGT